MSHQKILGDKPRETLTIEFQLAFSNLQLTYTHATFFTLDRVPSCKRAMMTSLAVHVLL